MKNTRIHLYQHGAAQINTIGCKLGEEDLDLLRRSILRKDILFEAVGQDDSRVFFRPCDVMMIAIDA